MKFSILLSSLLFCAFLSAKEIQISGTDITFIAPDEFKELPQELIAVSYTHLTLPTTPYV